MIRYLSFVAALVAAGPVSALSCSVPSVAGAYTQAAESPVNYVIGVGSLSLTGPSDPPEGAVARGGDINDMVGYSQPARFVGELFTEDGFELSQDIPVTVEVTCTIAWCGSAADVEYGLFFFQAELRRFVLLEDACPGFVFPDAHPRMLAEVMSCHQGACAGAC
ncbi:hypothetical protein K3728_01620 [Rhodobacteraceae bacterium M385]|nr:hypothetical protein K3728_01620 [Rhodobacteraceae bacterium M385]